MTTFTIPYAEDLPRYPDWPMDWLRERWEAARAQPELDIELSETAVRSDLIGNTLRSVTLEDGRIDRSKTLFTAGLKLGRQGATREEIVATLRELDENQGFRKYSRRRDGGLKDYTAIAQKALARQTKPVTEDGLRRQLPQSVPNPEASRNLFNIKRGSPPEDDQGKEPSPDDCHHYQGYIDTCWPIHRQRRQAAIQQGHPDRLTGEIRRHWEYLGANTRTENADFYRRGLTTVKVCIAVENPRLATPDLEPLLVALLGEHDRLGETTPAVKRIRDCGRHSKWVCSEKPDEHWDGIIGQYQCTLHYCPNCLTDIAGDLDRARLPDIDPEMGAAYRSVWLVGRYPLPPDLSEWESTLKALQKTWEFTLVKLQRRKGTKGSILWRSFTAFYTEQEAFIHWKIMLKEDSPGAADGSIADLSQTMGAEPYDDRRFVHGELASLQLVENARSHLLGFSQDMPWETKFAIFGAHYAATKGRHVFQGMGVLWSLLREAPKPEPPKCKVCAAPLRMVILRDEPPEEDAPVAGEKPTVSTPVYGYDPPDRPAAEAATAGAYWEAQI
jgi:hypothetical protein